MLALEALEFSASVAEMLPFALEMGFGAGFPLGVDGCGGAVQEVELEELRLEVEGGGAEGGVVGGGCGLGGGGGWD